MPTFGDNPFDDGLDFVGCPPQPTRLELPKFPENFKSDCKWCYMNPAVDINYLEQIILPIVPEIKGIEVATEFAY